MFRSASALGAVVFVFLSCGEILAQSEAPDISDLLISAPASQGASRIATPQVYLSNVIPLSSGAE